MSTKTKKQPKNPRKGQLRVWHIPQVPGTAFRYGVNTPVEGAKLIDVLARYDLFQYDNGIKPDYTNASGLEVFENGEWIEWAADNGDEVGKYVDALNELRNYEKA